MKIRTFILLGSLAVTGAGFNPLAHGQAVLVTAQLDTNQLVVGQSTTLRVFAQVAPNLRTNSDRIFSWYIDVLNTNSSAVAGLFPSLTKPASDNDPQTSSAGTVQGGNCRGIYDTFMNLAGAGVSNRVLLLSVPVSAVAQGQTLFSVSAGTGVSGLVNDFLVAPLGGGDPYLGADYSQAGVSLTVNSSSIQLQIQRVNASVLQLQFTPVPGHTNTVVSRSVVNSGSWTPLPGAPHNSGSVLVTNTGPQQFFRVQVD